jgi:hypothetical protein
MCYNEPCYQNRSQPGVDYRGALSLAASTEEDALSSRYLIDHLPKAGLTIYLPSDKALTNHIQTILKGILKAVGRDVLYSSR